MKKMTFIVHLHPVGDLDYQMLEFTTNNRRFFKSTIDVKRYYKGKYNIMEVNNESEDLSPSILGDYNEVVKGRLNMADPDGDDYYLFRNAVEKMSALFDVMSALTGFEWYY